MSSKRNVMSVSWGDHYEFGEGDGALDTQERIIRSAERWQSLYDPGKIYWREQRSAPKFRVGFTAPGASPRSGPREPQQTYMKLGFNEHELVTTKFRDMGYKVYLYMSIFDEGWPLSEGWGGGLYSSQSLFTIANPEYLVVDREGRRHYGVMEYAYPEVVQYTLGRIIWTLDDYPFDGVFICTRSQSKPAVYGDQFGFNEPIVEEFERRYGANILERNFDVEEWRRLRGEYFTLFLKELKKILSSRKMKLGVGVPRGDYLGPPLGNIYLDWRRWVREKIVDELVIDQVAVRCPSTWRLLWPRHRGFGYLCNDIDHYGIKGLDTFNHSIPLKKGSKEYGEAMNRLIQSIKNDYGPLCKDHDCRLYVARMWSVYDEEENESLLKTQGLSGLVLSSFRLDNKKVCERNVWPF